MNESLQPSEDLTHLPLSEDEQKALFKGIPYEELPETFTISEAVFESCLEVWKTFSEDNFSPKKYSAARERARAYFLKRLEEGGEEEYKARQRLAYLNREEKYETEFGVQIYLVDNKLVKGNVHKGKRKSILLRNNLDQISDEKSIVNIHNHPNNLTFSLQDLITVIADVEGIPQRCLYLVVTSAHLYLIFPTNDSQRIPLQAAQKLVDETKEEIWELEGLESEDPAKTQSVFISEVCKKASLGFYQIERGKTLSRVA